MRTGVCLMLLLIPAQVAASDQLYCGVYSMYAVLKSYDVDVELGDMITEKYISSRYGTTVRDLCQAATDYGLVAIPMQNMNGAMLKDSAYPVILHTRVARKGVPFQHWIVYLGSENGQARIVDPPNGPELISFAEVLAQWDGVGVIVADRKIAAPRVSRMGWLEIGIYFLASAGALTVVLAWRGSSTSQVGNMIRICGCALCLGILVHAISPEGFFRNRDAVVNVVTVHHARHLPEVTFEEIKNGGNAILIDARVADDFSQGHIPGAHSLPVSANASERVRVLSSVAKDAKVIVYCQSNGCLWSDEVGSDMVFRGYSDVSIYRGGYVEWQALAAAEK